MWIILGAIALFFCFIFYYDRNRDYDEHMPYIYREEDEWKKHIVQYATLSRGIIFVTNGFAENSKSPTMLGGFTKNDFVKSSAILEQSPKTNKALWRWG